MSNIFAFILGVLLTVGITKPNSRHSNFKAGDCVRELGEERLGIITVIAPNNRAVEVRYENAYNENSPILVGYDEIKQTNLVKVECEK
jgi:hypothetical protein